MDKSKHTPWELLTGSPVLEAILTEWKNLLSDDSNLEAAYQDFLRRHAAMFFPPVPLYDEIVLSGLRLGSDHEVDFVMAHSERSMGFIYTLVEIETPHESAYKNSGDPRPRLIHAIQQTTDWKSWINENPDQVRKLFPSKRLSTTGLSHFRYMVVMGRRSDRFNEKRNVLANQNDVQIRSFDWFTDNLVNRRFKSFNAYTSDIIQPTHEEDNAFSNPFSQAYKDASWRSIVNEPYLRGSHMVGHNLDILTKYRDYNLERQRAFFEYLNTLPGGPHHPSDSEYWRMRHR